MSKIDRILAPTDFAKPSEHALMMAVDMARLFGARLTLFHVWATPFSYTADFPGPTFELRDRAEEALEEVRARTEKVYPNTDAVLRVGGECIEILSAIEELRIGLVVMGTHARQGLSRFFLGSVTERTVRLSPVPVLTVGPPAPLGTGAIPRAPTSKVLLRSTARS